MGARTSVDFADPRFIRRFGWNMWRRANLGALIGSVTAGIIAALSAPVYFRGLPNSRVIPFFLIFSAPAYAIAAVIGAVIMLRIVRRAMRWASEGRAPAADDIARLARMPREAAITVCVLWVVFVAALVAIFTRYAAVDWPQTALQASFLTLAYSGLQGATLAYLFTERTVRPVLANVLPADTTTWPKMLGVTQRLLIAFFIVSGAPLMLIAFNIGRLNEAQRAVAGTSFVIACLLSAAIGVIVYVIAGQAITAPLERLRAALKRVAAGDLDVEVVAHEAGEIGLLQAGFNQMVEGLRERERMRDVFGRHVGAEVARRAMETELGVGGGERCHATAMFVDIIGSTGLSLSKDPSAVVGILNRFFDAVVRVVASEGGLVNKFQGDGALCLFGTPLPCDDHAARGLRAARALASELAPMGDIAAAIGVSSGEVVAGNVGAADRYEYTVIGDAVNEAARLTEQAKLLSGARVLVSERTIRAAAAEQNGWEAGETIQLRGRIEPTLTYHPR